MKDNREKLEQIALELVQRRGLSGVSFRTLADAVGIKSSSVHYHFPDKSDLANALIDHYSEAFMQRLQRIVEQSGTLRQKLRAFIGIFEEVAEAEKLCLCGMLAAEREHLDDSSRERLRNYFQQVESSLVSMLDAQRDEIIIDVPPRVLARNLFAALEGALLIDRVSDNQDLLKAQKRLVTALTRS